MTGHDKITMVIPTLNRGYVIERAVASVCEQTYPYREVVVVDDGSADDTREVVQGIGRDDVRYIAHSRNLGVAAAANTGLRAVTTEFIGFMGSDDVLKPNMMAALIAVFDQHPEVDAVFGDVEIVEGLEGEPWTAGLSREMPVFSKMLPKERASAPIIVPRRAMYMCLLEEVPVKPSTMIVRRRVFDRIGGFAENFKSAEDWEWLLRLVRITDFGYVDEPIVRMYTLPDATHRVMREADKLGVIALLSREHKAASGDREAQLAARRGIISSVQLLGWHYRTNSQYWRAFVTYVRGFLKTKSLGLAARAAFAWVSVEAQDRWRAWPKQQVARWRARA